jgi:parallel beta-helix repeat protein
VKKVSRLLAAATRRLIGGERQQSAACRTKAAVHESLEPRLLFSADISPVNLLADAADSNSLAQVSMQPSVVQSQQSKQGVELVVLDARVENIALLLNDIANQQASGRPFVLIEVNAQDDGIAAISEAIARAQSNNLEVQALHIISHGRDGEFDLGRQKINQEFVRQNAQVFSQWASGFSSDGDFLIYGCNFAQSGVGQALAQSIAALTGADVAANLQATGDVALGGDWLLEYQTGLIQTADAISSNAQSTWHELLQIATTGAPQVVGTGTGNQYSAGSAVGVATTPNLGAYTSGGRSVAIDKNGNFAVVWIEENVGVKVQAYFANGTLRGGETNIGSFEAPSIAMTDTGEFVVAYSDKGFPADKKIWVQRFASDGSIVGAASVVSEVSGLSARRPSIAINNNKQYAVAWEELNPAPLAPRPSGIYASAFEWTGSAMLSSSYLHPIIGVNFIFQSIRVDTGGGISEARPAIAMSNDHVYVTWGSAVTTTQYDVMMQSFSISSGSYGNVTRVNTATGLNNVQPDIASNASGRIVVTWQAGNATYEAVRYRLFNDNLSASVPNPVVSPFTPIDKDFGPIGSPSHQALPKVSINDDGSFFIVEQDGAQNPFDLEIWGRQFNANGVSVGPLVAINNVPTDPNSSANSQFGAGIATRGQYAVATWNTVPQNGGNFDVLVRTATISKPALITSSFPLTLNEGQSQTITLRLSEPPVGDAKFDIATGNTGVASVNIGTVTFNATNWNINQTVTVTAASNSASLADTNFTLGIKARASNTNGFADIAEQSGIVDILNTDPVYEIVVDTLVDNYDSTDVTSLQALMRNKGADDHISLREAILAANATPNSGVPTKILFKFELSPGILPTIEVASPLPSISVPVEIDGAIGSSAGYVALAGQTSLNFGGLGLWGTTSGVDGASGSVIKHLVFSNFGQVGLSVSASNVKLDSNYFGLSPIGLSSSAGVLLGGNAAYGLSVFGNGSDPVGHNIISNNYVANNGFVGIKIAGSNYNVLSANVIGLGADGLSSMGNFGVGIYIGSEAGGSTLQTHDTSLLNNTIVASTGDGIFLHGIGVQNTLVQSNFVGTDSNGANGLRNVGNGIHIDAGASNTLVLANIIKNNGRAGIKVVSNGVDSLTNEFKSNRIYDNQQLQIDLATFDFSYATPTPNDAASALDSDTGSNGLTNFPELVNAFVESSGTRVQGVLHAAANTDYRIEAFSSTATDIGGRGQAALYLGSTVVTTDASGAATINFLGGQAAIPGQFVSATATRLIGGSLYGETSEMSQAVVVAEPLGFVIGETPVYMNENVIGHQISARDYLNDPTRTGWKFSLTGIDDDIYATIDENTGVLTVNTANYEYLTSALGGGDNEWWFHVNVTNPADTVQTSSIVLKLQVLNINEQASITDESGSARNDFTVAEDSVIFFTGSKGIQIHDPDVVLIGNPVFLNNPSDMEVSISVVNASNVPSGFLAIGDTSLRTAFTDTAIVLRGTQDALNAALLTLQLQPAVNDTSSLTVSVTVNDFGSGISGQVNNPMTSSVTISFVASNDAPVVSGLPPSIPFFEGMNPVPIAPAIMLVDVDSVMLQGASIKIISGYVGGEDTLGLLASAVLPGSVAVPTFDLATGELVFIGAATVSEYEAFLRSVTFNNTSTNPTTGTRSVRWSVYDGAAWSLVPMDVNIQVASVNSPPVLSGPSTIAVPYLGTFHFSDLGAAVGASDIDSGTSQYNLQLSVTGSGLLTLNSATGLTIVSGSVVNRSWISVIGNIASIENALRQLDFISVGNSIGSDEIQIDLTQLGLPLNDPSATANRLVIPVLIDAPIAPAIFLGQRAFTFTEGGSATSPFAGITLAVGSVGVIHSANVSIDTGFDVGFDQLSVTQTALPGISISLGSTGNTIEIVGNGSAADYEAILRTVTFSNSSANPTNLSKQIALVVDDGSLNATTNVNMSVAPVNNPPSLSGLASLVVLEDSSANILTPTILNVADPDSAVLSLRISVQSGTLAWAQSSIQPSGVVNASATEFVLQGTQAEIMSWAAKITYTPTANFSGVVDVRWDLADDASTPAHALGRSSVTVTAVNDAPLLVLSIPVSVEQGKSVVISAANSNATDIEDLSSTLRYQVSALPQHGQVLLSGRTLTLSDSFTQADIDAGRVAYLHNDDVIALDRFNIVVRDSQGASSSDQSITIGVALRNPVFVVPVASGVGGSTATGGNTSAQAVVATAESAASTKATGGSGGSGGEVSNLPPAALNVGQSNTARNATKETSQNGSGVGATATQSLSVAAGNTSNARERDLVIQETEKPVAKLAELSSINKRQETDRSANSLDFTKLRTQAENTQYSELMRKFVGDTGFVNDVQKVRDDAKKTIKFDAKVVASTTAVSAGISIGYVIWLVRGGALLSSLLASLPAWQLMDPLPVLGSMGGGDSNDDDESLDEMIKKSHQTKAENTAKAANAAQLAPDATALAH